MLVGNHWATSGQVPMTKREEKYVIRFVYWILSLCLAIGVGDAFVRLTLEMCRAAVHAHQHDQLSYSRFTHALLSAKPRSVGNEAHESPKH